MSRLVGPQGNRERLFTFFGLGLHEYRDRYFIDEWRYYTTSLTAKGEPLTVEELETILEERKQYLAPEVARHKQSRRGKLFEEITDLSDDDGTIVDMEDFADFFDEFGDEWSV